MYLRYGGIHKRIGFIIQHCGGYDKEYHILKISSQLNINKDTITELFNASSRSNLPHYIELLENNVPIENIINMVNKDNEIISRKFNNMLNTIGSLYHGAGAGSVFDDVYHNLLKGRL